LEEYIKEYHLSFQYSRFLRTFTRSLKGNNAVLHYGYTPARLLKVGFAGKILHYLDFSTGDLIPCLIFVTILSVSGYTS
jgi:hypothetical protein